MSLRNGERARFQINRKRKVRHRQRIGALLRAFRASRDAQAAAHERAAGAGEPQPARVVS